MKISDEDFIAAWRRNGGSPAMVAADVQMSRRFIAEKAAKLRKQGIDLPVLSANPAYFVPRWTYPREERIELTNAVVMVASDLHMWPASHQPRPAIQQMFLELAHELRPTALVFAGDVVDGTRISRHGAIRGQATPTVAEEVDAFAAYCREFPHIAHKHVTVGNHDLRIDNYLAQNAAEMADWAGRLEDRTPGWVYSYALWINHNVEVRHDWHGGIHAAYNNALRSGVTTVTGHTHKLICTPHQNRTGTHYGIECGMLNDRHGPQWEYTHGRSNQWRSGFVVLTFDEEGRLLPPELGEMHDGRVIFRGRVLNKPRVRVAAGRAA